MRDGDDRRARGDGQGQNRRGRNDQWRGGDGNGASAVPVPNPEDVQRQGRGRERGDGHGRPNRRGNDGANAVPAQGQQHSGMRQGGRSERMRGGDDGRGYRQAPAQPVAVQDAAPAARPAPQPHVERVRQQAPRQRAIDGAVERPQ